MKIRAISRPASLSRRLAGFSIVFVTAAMIAASAILYLIVAAVVREQIDQRLDTQLGGLRRALTADAKGAITLNGSLDGPPFDRLGSGWYWEVTGDGVNLTSRSLAGASIERPPRRFDWRRSLTGEPQPGEKANLHGEKLHLRATQAVIGNKVVQVVATAPEAALRAPARRALLWLIPAMTLLGGSLVAGIFLQVRYGLRPLRKLTSDISAISAGTLSRLPDIDVEELQPGSQEINRLVDQNQQRLAETRLHFANLAHGLKTPVSSLLLALNAANDPDQELRDLVEKIDQRIRHHLARARKTAGGGVRASTPVKPCVDGLILIMSRVHVERGVTATCSIDPELQVLCSPEDLDEILGNLIDNAFKWAKSAIHISAEISASEVIIIVQDDGPGMPEGKMEDAFNPGIRMDEAVPGDGFGLTIAQELAGLYGGKVTLENGRSGGLICRLAMPRSSGATGSGPPVS